MREPSLGNPDKLNEIKYCSFNVKKKMLTPSLMSSSICALLLLCIWAKNVSKEPLLSFFLAQRLRAKKKKNLWEDSFCTSYFELTYIFNLLMYFCEMQIKKKKKIHPCVCEREKMPLFFFLPWRLAADWRPCVVGMALCSCHQILS